MEFKYEPKGEFNLLFQNQFFNGWPTKVGDPNTIVMAFPVEGWQSSAVVSLSQLPNGSLAGKVYGSAEVEQAKMQSLAAMSLDEDGTEWRKVGKRDVLIGQLQEKYNYMRPTLFHSPYEAAAAFIIGHRITIAQARALRVQMAEQYGEKIKVEGEVFYSFPLPQKLLELVSFKGLNETKIERLHAVAQAALDGLLDRQYLRALDEAEALQKLETLPGVGPFFAQGILYRGAGVADGFTSDDLTYGAIGKLHNLADDSKDILLEVAEKWRPFRMWAIVLLHVWLRESGQLPKRTFGKQ